MSLSTTPRCLPKIPLLLRVLFTLPVIFLALPLAGSKFEFKIPEFKVIEEPKATHVETEALFRRLEVAKTIPPELDKENFMVRPSSFTFDQGGNIHTVDRLLKKVFTFDKNGRFIRSWGRLGMGPGEFGAKASMNYIYASADKHLYVSEYSGCRVSRFAPDGSYTYDFKVHNATPMNTYVTPVVAPWGEIAVRNRETGAFDIYKINGMKLEKSYSLLGMKEFATSIILGPEKQEVFVWLAPNEYNGYIDVLPGERWIIFLPYSSTVYIFKRDTLQAALPIRPKLALKIFKKKIARFDASTKHGKGKSPRWIFMFLGFFVDKDDQEHFYLESRGESEPSKRRRLLYKFDLKGNLKQVYFVENICLFRGKSNGNFYSLGGERDSINFLKERTHEK